MCKARERPDSLGLCVVEDLLSGSATPGIQLLPDIWVYGSSKAVAMVLHFLLNTSLLVSDLTNQLMEKC